VWRRGDQVRLFTRRGYDWSDRYPLIAAAAAALAVDATIDGDAVTAAVRGAGAKHIAERSPNLGQMSDAEFREYKSQFGV
jgi:ATP-dependent DNA ligase